MPRRGIAESRNDSLAQRVRGATLQPSAAAPSHVPADGAHGLPPLLLLADACYFLAGGWRPVSRGRGGISWFRSAAPRRRGGRSIFHVLPGRAVCPRGHLRVSCEEMPVRVLRPVLNRVVCFLLLSFSGTLYVLDIHRSVDAQIPNLSPHPVGCLPFYSVSRWCLSCTKLSTSHDVRFLWVFCRFLCVRYRIQETTADSASCSFCPVFSSKNFRSCLEVFDPF